MQITRLLRNTLLGVGATLAFAVAPASASDAALRDTVYNDALPMTQRVDAMRELTGLGKHGNDTRKICIWDIVGRNGPIFSAAQDQRARLLEYGIQLDLIPYTDERVMVDEFKAGLCDAALMSGLRARLFNTYTGTIDSIGGLPTQQHMRILLQVLADPASAKHMVQGDYVVAGIAPGGGAYLFVNDKKINSLAAAAGKNVAVLDYDPVQAEMVGQVGASPVPTDIVNAPNMFNNGVVDVLAAPLAAYEIVELYKGMTPDGGIVNYPIAQISMQLVGRLDKFPNEVAQLIREASFEAYDEVRARVKTEEDRVPDRWWIDIPSDEKREYEAMMQEARDTLRQQDYYDGRMLDLQSRIRCKFDPSRGECSNNK